MSRNRWLALSGASIGALLVCAAPSGASETISYAYDALGRLVVAKSSGSVNNNQARSLCYDPAGNRTVHKSSDVGAIAGCAPTPTPTPTPPSFDIANAPAVAEGGALVYTVSKSGSTTGTFTVDYATANGTATSGSDFSSASGTLTFLAGDTAKTIVISTIDDTIYEPDETVLVNLSAASGGASISNAQGSGTILNNDPVNLPPTTVADVMSVQKCGVSNKNVVANDSDPEGNVPLVLLSAWNVNGSRGEVHVSTSTTLYYIAYHSPGTDTIYYTVQDSLGATSTGTVSVTITNLGALCNAQ